MNSFRASVVIVVACCSGCIDPSAFQTGNADGDATVVADQPSDYPDGTLDPMAGMNTTTVQDGSMSPSQPSMPPSQTPATPQFSPELTRLIEMGFMKPPVLPHQTVTNEQLSDLVAWGTSIPFDDSDAPVLLEFPNLAKLGLARTQITDATLMTVGEFTNLEHLDLSRTEVTDAGVQHLAGLSKLNFLNLSGTKITDDTLQLVAESFPELERLFIEGVAITDAGLMHLAALPKLRLVLAEATYATPTGAEALRQELPECQIQVSK